jgi:ABC-type Fe3+-hydroxamate transport system substrate-binding protein
MPESSRMIRPAGVALAAALFLAACGGASPSASKSTSTTVAPTTSTTVPVSVPKALASLSKPSASALAHWVWAYEDLDFSQRSQFDALAPSYQETYLDDASSVSWNPDGPVSATEASELSTILTREVHAYRRVLQGQSGG